jgi:hypothetical protein
MGSSECLNDSLVTRQELSSPPYGARLSWRLLIPGLSQINWGQRERGMVFLIGFMMTLATSLFCWGGMLGWCFLILCFLTHMAASLDVARQRSFPVLPGRLAVAAAIVGMGLTLYLPIGALLRSFALSTGVDRTDGSGYLVNLLAYRERDPALGHFIWMRLTPSSSPRAGHVVAVAGQEVEWNGRCWQVDGKTLESMCPGALPYFPNPWRFQVPPNHVLIGPETSTSNADPSSALVIVSKEQIVGRAWARYYPVWERCLL